MSSNSNSNSIGSNSAILVKQNQKNNPLLKYISNVPWEFYENSVYSKTDFVMFADYILNPTCCAFYCTLSYHLS